MDDPSSIDYYRTRQIRELEMAQMSSKPEVVAIHREMARRYAALIAASMPAHMHAVATVGVAASGSRRVATGASDRCLSAFS
jgi:hypothetical protein